MEVKVLDLGNGENVRFYEKDGIRWFCLVDICKCLDMKKDAASSYGKRIEKDQIEGKVIPTGNGAERPVNFITEDAACQLVFKSRSRSEKGKAMKTRLLSYVKGKEKINSPVRKTRALTKKISTIENEEDENEDQDDVDEKEIVNKPKPARKEEKKDVLTVYNPFVASSTTDPEIAKMYFETERYKADLEFKLKEKQIDLSKKESEIKHWQFCNKKIFKYGSTMEKERFLNHARMIGDKLLVDYLPEKNYGKF